MLPTSDLVIGGFFTSADLNEGEEGVCFGEALYKQPKVLRRACILDND